MENLEKIEINERIYLFMEGKLDPCAVGQVYCLSGERITVRFNGQYYLKAKLEDFSRKFKSLSTGYEYRLLKSKPIRNHFS